MEFGATSLFNISFRTFLSLSSERPTKLDVSFSGSYWSVKSMDIKSLVGNAAKDKVFNTNSHRVHYVN